MNKARFSELPDGGQANRGFVAGITHPAMSAADGSATRIYFTSAD